MPEGKVAEDIDPQVKARYVANGVEACPSCGGQRIAFGPVEVCDCTGWSDVECIDCHATWKEVWRMVDVVELVPG